MRKTRSGHELGEVRTGSWQSAASMVVLQLELEKESTAV